MKQTKSILYYRGWALISKIALKAYFVMPRETLQDEFFALHRYAMKKAHSARLRGNDAT